MTDLAILSADQRAAHDYLWAYRNKHVAHSVKAFEENVSRANYCLKRVKEEGDNFYILWRSPYHGSECESFEECGRIERCFSAHVDSLIAKEQERLLVIVRKMPLAEGLAGGRKAFVVDTQVAVSKDRKK